MISIVIPTLNEEKYLPKLLESIRRQPFRNYEIIIADNDSVDKTASIAKRYKCRIISGGLPAKARNNGAAAAKHDLLFLDADVVLKDRCFLEEFLRAARRYDIATCFVLPDSGCLSHRIYYSLKNRVNFLTSSFLPHVSGQCLYVKRGAFMKAGGYDESLILGEEHELAQRIVKNDGRLGFFAGLSVHNSPRRIEKEGFFRLLLKSSYSELYRAFGGKIKKQIFEYEFGKY